MSPQSRSIHDCRQESITRASQAAIGVAVHDLAERPNRAGFSFAVHLRVAVARCLSRAPVPAKPSGADISHESSLSYALSHWAAFGIDRLACFSVRRVTTLVCRFCRSGKHQPSLSQFTCSLAHAMQTGRNPPNDCLYLNGCFLLVCNRPKLFFGSRSRARESNPWTLGKDT